MGPNSIKEVFKWSSVANFCENLCAYTFSDSGIRENRLIWLSFHVYHYLHSLARIHHVKFLAFHGNQLEYNGSQGENGGD